MDYTEEKGRVVVWWPKHVGGKKWEGHLVYIYRNYAQSVVSFILRDVIFFAGEKSINSYYNMQGMQDECVLIINTYARLLCSFGLLANFPYNFVR